MERWDWDRRYEASELIWTASPNRFVVEELSDLSPGRALDLAAGEGRNAVWLAERGWAVTAVDFSSVGLDKARQLAGSRGVSVDLVAADLREYALGEGAYDLVLVAYLHLPPADWHDVLRRAVAAVAPGGTLLVVGHDVTNLTDGVGGPPDPTILYDVDALAAELDDLTILRAERVRRPVEVEEGTRDAIDTLLRATRSHPSPPC